MRTSVSQVQSVGEIQSVFDSFVDLAGCEVHIKRAKGDVFFYGRHKELMIRVLENKSYLLSYFSYVLLVGFYR